KLLNSILTKHKKTFAFSPQLRFSSLFFYELMSSLQIQHVVNYSCNMNCGQE
ncbi:hypothetical protein L9F63_007427, partial [Diploptera punctata]